MVATGNVPWEVKPKKSIRICLAYDSIFLTLFLTCVHIQGLKISIKHWLSKVLNVMLSCSIKYDYYQLFRPLDTYFTEEVVLCASTWS